MKICWPWHPLVAVFETFHRDCDPKAHHGGVLVQERIAYYCPKCRRSRR